MSGSVFLKAQWSQWMAVSSGASFPPSKTLVFPGDPLPKLFFSLQQVPWQSQMTVLTEPEEGPALPGRGSPLYQPVPDSLRGFFLGRESSVVGRREGDLAPYPTENKARLGSLAWRGLRWRRGKGSER